METLAYKLSEPFNYYNDKEFSEKDNISFWEEVSKKYINWDKIYDKVWSGNENKPEWFKGGKLNLCNNALDRHLSERGDQIALFHECPALEVSSTLTYNELWKKVCIFSRALKNLGVKKGDKVLIFMPTMMECAIAMLSCARIGAIHSVTYIAYNFNNLSQRIEHLKPKILITVNFGVKENKYTHYVPTIKKALEKSIHKIETIIMLDRIDFINKEKQLQYLEKNKEIELGYQTLENTIDYKELVDGLEPLLEYELLDAVDPIYFLYTSGTTGHPKGAVAEAGGFLVQALYSYNRNYGISPGETFFTPSDIGWQLGHNLLYASLFIGGRFVLYEGDLFVPTLDVFRVIEMTEASLFLSVPTEFRTFQKLDPNAKEILKYNLDKLRAIILCGEVLDSSIFNYVTKTIKKPVVDNYGQTETGWCIITSSSQQIPFKIFSCGKPVPGFNTKVINPENREPAKPNEIGELLIKLPVPPSCIQTLLLDVNQEQYSRKYLNKYPGYYGTGDLCKFDEDGNYYIMSRVDDVINVGGDLVYNTLCEDIIQKNKMILENIVAAGKDDYYGQVPIGFIILKKEFKSIYDENKILFLSSLKKELNDVLETSHFLPNSTLKHLVVVTGFPKTRSNKKIRNVVSKIFNDEAYEISQSMSNPEVINNLISELDEFKLVLLKSNEDI
ncbi:hypothetical protein DICPUDRAFT_27694 [Dictyostelium purpureum]|uniref:AMP-dependent synthetase/ligase domain-containing protein n=1 Tax=Dictyostelium purpureum TaxID=5786 RepID=F0ZAK1_DICPU|nr:uncharacterized protein DICPUDRAFT_27694 [Dictyostelium purpureum]EGC38987.1 hypothetical protein DICPUDRAFT_27694 [Dictyostelium purpureum]|eukprot:XP_003284440.1 hypothetical protein DICPUDRAFT_27694 [Dictyostelium purpureum]